MSVRHAPDSRYPNKPWLAEVYVDGRRTRRRYRTQREAQAADREIHGRKLPKAGIEAALLEWHRTCLPRLRKPGDPLSHARALRQHIEGRTWSDVPEIVRELTRAHQHLSTATLNRRLQMLRRLCRLAVQWGWVDTTPRISLLPESGREVFLTPAQVELIAGHMPRAGDIVRLLAYTGLRVTEALSLRPEHVAHGGLAVETLKQRQRAVRWVPVPRRCLHILDALPFAVSRQVLRTEWERARLEAKLPHLRLHDLRHTYASLLAALGASDSELAALLGHTDRRMIQRYAHLRADHLRAVVDGL